MPTSTPTRRSFLKAAGVCIALPALESLSGLAGENSARADQAKTPPRRMVCVGNEFGVYPGAFWPTKAGRDYELTPLLKPLENHRQDFTLFSHLDHGLKGGHFAIHAFLTGVKSVEAKGSPDGGISLDQRAAEHVGSQTRFPSLAIGSEDGLHGGCPGSRARGGAGGPPIAGPRELFRLLFVDDDERAREKAADRIAMQGS